MHLNDILIYNSESFNIDFKQTEYPLGKYFNKNEFLKDISAMANHPSNEKKYIFVGVTEKDGLAASFIDIPQLTDQAKYQQFLEKNIEPTIKFEYLQFEHEGYKLGCFIIYGNTERPYLFKKEVQNAKTNELEYKPGDGYIRVGTSTRKMIRSDFEQIYKARNQFLDRKSDLLITPYIRKCDDVTLMNTGLSFIDFKISNKSNKSISFDAQAKIYYNVDIKLIKRFEVERQIDEENRKKARHSITSFDFTPMMDNSIFSVSLEKNHDHLLVSTVKTVHQKNSIEISQNDELENLFAKEVLILGNKEYTVTVDLILRSDDFIEGALIESFEIKE